MRNTFEAGSKIADCLSGLSDREARMAVLIALVATDHVDVLSDPRSMTLGDLLPMREPASIQHPAAKIA